MKTLGKYLRQLRSAARLSQQEVADILNKNRSTYTYYETGKCEPDIETIIMLAKIFGVTPSDIIYEGNAPAVGKQQYEYDLSLKEKKLISLLRKKPESELDMIIDRLKGEID